MKSSIYQKTDGAYLAVLSNGQRVQRGSLDDLALVLSNLDIGDHDLLFGDWIPEAAPLLKAEQEKLMKLMKLSLPGGDLQAIETDA